MSGFIRRSLLVCSALLVLTACQSLQQDSSAQQVDEFAAAQVQFEAHLDAQQLALAGQQLDELSNTYADEPRLLELQQALANAWLAKGEQALQNADLTAASAALIQAKRLLPQAPALTEGLSAALSAAQTPTVQEPAPTPAATAPAKRAAPPSKAKPAPAVKVEPEQEEAAPSIEPSAADTAETVTPAPQRTLRARIIDANAPYSVIPLPMLRNRNDHQLGRVLDDVAVDVVRFRAAVTIEVADTRDFHWVAALLSTRVKKINASFKPRLKEVIRSEEPAQLIITPSSSL